MFTRKVVECEEENCRPTVDRSFVAIIIEAL